MSKPRSQEEEIQGNKKKRFQHWHLITFYLMVYDVIAVNASYFIALWIRFDCQFSHIEEQYLTAFLKFAPIYTVACLVVFWLLKLYRSIWRFASYKELGRIIVASLATGVLHLLGITAAFHRMPITYYILGFIIQFFAITAVRFSYRFILLERENLGKRRSQDGAVGRVMLIGGGNAGQLILHDIQRARETREKVVCIIDDNPNKWNRYIDGVPVVGGRDEILASVDKYGVDKIYMAIPGASAESKRDILNICKETGCELKNLPGVYQLVNGDVTVNSLKKVEIADLLGREQIRVDLEEIFGYLRGKIILVTGGGGSIGSELCRQIAAHQPKQLIIFDVYENNAYDIQQELKKKYPDLKLETIIGSVRDSRKINQVFEKYKPNVVYHAAAHKHVPLMEDSPCEAIKNNVIGTYKTAYAAMLNGCDRFVLISTDKAVNPTNVMGASKRMCEMVIQTFDYYIKQGRADLIPHLYAHAEDEAGSMEPATLLPTNIHTEYVAVRFGNVLGSNGSVIPLFRKQIEAGGPVTVTHPDIIRYFMTIPEAVSLVLQAGTYAKGGEIFVLDMGEPVKIDDLARNLIKLSGLRPDVDIKIAYTGLRPGEKLFEEKLMAEEGLKTTANSLIHIGCPIAFDHEKFLTQIREIMVAAYANDENIREYVKEIVGTYKPAK